MIDDFGAPHAYTGDSYQYRHHHEQDDVYSDSDQSVQEVTTLLLSDSEQDVDVATDKFKEIHANANANLDTALLDPLPFDSLYIPNEVEGTRRPHTTSQKYGTRDGVHHTAEIDSKFHRPYKKPRFLAPRDAVVTNADIPTLNFPSPLQLINRSYYDSSLFPSSPRGDPIKPRQQLKSAMLEPETHLNWIKFTHAQSNPYDVTRKSLAFGADDSGATLVDPQNSQNISLFVFSLLISVACAVACCLVWFGLLNPLLTVLTANMLRSWEPARNRMTQKPILYSGPKLCFRTMLPSPVLL